MSQTFFGLGWDEDMAHRLGVEEEDIQAHSGYPHKHNLRNARSPRSPKKLQVIQHPNKEL